MRKLFNKTMWTLIWAQLLSFTSCKNVQKMVPLSAEQLEKATSVVYHSSNGSVAPDYHFDCYVNVVKDNVNVTIFQGYDKTVVYRENHALSQTEYQQFLDYLAKQGISKNTKEDIIPTSGGDVSAISVETEKQVVFRGEEHLDLVIEHGRLIDAFLVLLPDSMQQVVRKPYEKLKQE